MAAAMVDSHHQQMDHFDQQQDESLDYAGADAPAPTAAAASLSTRTTVDWTLLSSPDELLVYLSAAPIRKNKNNNGRTVYLRFDATSFQRNKQLPYQLMLENDVFAFETPFMMAPFGVSTFTGEKGESQYNATLSFKPHPYDDKVPMFEAWVTTVFDPAIRRLLASHCKEWLGVETTTDEGVAMIYNGLCRRKGDHGNQMSLKIMATADGSMDAAFFTFDRKPSHSSNVPKQGYGRALAEVPAISFVGKAIYCTARLKQMRHAMKSELATSGGASTSGGYGFTD